MDKLWPVTPTGLESTATFQSAVASLLLAFVLGQVVAWVYMYTHAGLSYSRAFVQSIVLLTFVVALSMLVIGSNIAVAFGLIGALAVIRFRNILKDTRDTAFIFFSLVAGMGCGTGSYRLAIAGTATFCALLLYLHWASFGSRHTGDGFLRFQVTGDTPVGMVQEILRRHCHASYLQSQRIYEADMGEMSYRLTMRDPTRADRMIDELREVVGISHLSFVVQEDEAEV